VVKGEISVCADVFVYFLNRRAWSVEVGGVAANLQMDFGLGVYAGGVFSLQLNDRADCGAEPISCSEYVELVDDFWQHGPMFWGACL
jgi:hypothetical protein